MILIECLYNSQVLIDSLRYLRLLCLVRKNMKATHLFTEGNRSCIFFLIILTALL